ncbi:NUDIX hydrolase [Streptomyces sp. NPDC048409]|uniref:NUDIX hydrolase n=1 Tax=Streptomyces sp. NPDC048409 TaxID=3154723 RepID=UPI0034477CD3
MTRPLTSDLATPRDVTPGMTVARNHLGAPVDVERNPNANAEAGTWQAVEELGASAGFLRVRARRYRMPDSSLMDWDILHGGRTVSVLALDHNGMVILAEQFRPGPQRVLRELPGGNVEEDEDVLAAALRELYEETGYTAGRAEVVGSTWLAAYASHRRYAVLAVDCVRAGSPERQPGEFCRTVLLPLEEFVGHLRSGELTDTDIGYMCWDALQSGGSSHEESLSASRPAADSGGE